MRTFSRGRAPGTAWVEAPVCTGHRAACLTKQAGHKALATAYELYLFDARWFLDTIQAKNGALKGTDVLSEGLTKEERDALTEVTA